MMMGGRKGDGQADVWAEDGGEELAGEELEEESQESGELLR